MLYKETCISHRHEQAQYDLLTYYFQPSTLDLAVVDVALANISPFGLGVYL